MKMRALKSMRYGTRRLKAGDEFEPSGRWARIYRGTRQAEVVPDQPERAPAPKRPEPAAPESTGPTRSDVYRMNKGELASFIRGRGEEADEDDESRDDLRDRALDLLS